MLITITYLTRGQAAPEAHELSVMVRAWEYACSHIPTRHLEKCFRNALNAKRDSFPLTAGEVNLQWEGLKEVLLIQAETPDTPLLNASPEGYMTLADWKARHSLPAEWALGDPYPPQSDLYNVPAPLPYPERKLYYCFRCKDAGWTRIPYDARSGMRPELVKCDCK